MKPALVALVAALAAACTSAPPDAELARLHAAAEAERAGRVELERRLREAEEARERAEARAKAADEARELATHRNAEQLAATEHVSAEVRRLEAQVTALEARETEHGWILTLGNDLLFDVARATLKPGGRRAIANVAKLMRRHPERRIVVEGFTDNTGSPAANRRLSERRAQAVRQALIREGVEPKRITARGLGASYPVASNTSAGGRQLNRRVEILIGEEVGRAATGATAPSR